MPASRSNRIKPLVKVLADVGQGRRGQPEGTGPQAARPAGGPQAPADHGAQRRSGASAASDGWTLIENPHAGNVTNLT